MAKSAQIPSQIQMRPSFLAPGLGYVLPALAAVAVGVLVALPSGYTLLLAITVAIWLVLWTLLWRAAFIGLFLFLPVAALPGIFLQQQGWPIFIKDGLFLLPGYLGLALTLMKNRTFKLPLPASLTLLLFGLIAIVALQFLRLFQSAPLVALIGIRSWLLYVPLIVVPTFVFLSFGETLRFVRLLVVVSLIPALVGILEFALIVFGYPDLAYQWYGTLGSDVSQHFALVGVSDQLFVNRIPSTFTFVTQFVAYCLITTPICLVVWLCDPDPRWRRVGAIATMAIIGAGFASGSRTFYLWGPIEVGLTALLIHRGRLKLAIVTAVVVSIATLTIGVQLVQITTFITGLGWDYLVKTQAAEFALVYQSVGLLGAGVGIDTGGSRYVLSSTTLPYGVEGWYALTLLELGLPGLIIVLSIWIVLLRHAWFGVRTTQQSPAAPMAVAAFVILAAAELNLYKGVSLQYDPLDLYFWFMAGVALALPNIAARADISFKQAS